MSLIGRMRVKTDNGRKILAGHVLAEKITLSKGGMIALWKNDKGQYELHDLGPRAIKHDVPEVF